MSRAIRAFTVGSDGVAGGAFVEFTIFAPMLLLMIIMTMDFGLLIYRKMEVQNAAQAGAEYAAASYPDSSCPSSTCPTFSSSSSCNINVAAGGATTFSAIQASQCQQYGCATDAGVTAATQGSKCSDGTTAGTYVTVNTTATYNVFVPNPLFSNPLTLNATATVRVQ